MKTLGLFWLFTWLFRSSLGRLLLLGLLLWYLDNRYFGLLAAIWAPVRRWQRLRSLCENVEINPSDVRSMVELGELSLQGGKPRIAVDYLQRAVDRGENSARALYLLGAAQVRLGRFEEGKADLEAALTKTPNIAYGEPHLYLLEEALATQGPDSPLVEELVGKLDPFDSVELLTRAGQICLAAGRRDLARRLFQEAVHNYSYIPIRMRRRQRRWLVRARLGLLRV